MSDSAFDRLAGWLDSPVVVVVAADGEERSGCLVGFHCQCSIDPSRYAVWISRANHTYGVARRAERLTVHVLDSDDGDVAAVFGGLTGDEVDKWEALDGLGLQLPEPTFDGRIVDVIDDGVCDHVLFLVAPAEEGGDGLPDLPPLRLSDVAGVRAGHPVDDGPG